MNTTQVLALNIVSNAVIAKMELVNGPLSSHVQAALDCWVQETRAYDANLLSDEQIEQVVDQLTALGFFN